MDEPVYIMAVSGTAESSPSSVLLALVDDAQRVIFEMLSDALLPTVALNLAVCCRKLHAISEGLRINLRQRHNDARRLCARVNTSCAAVSKAKELLWYGQGFTMVHMQVLGSLIGTNALQHLEVLNLSINRFGQEGMQALSEGLVHGSLPQLLSLDLTGNKLGPAGAMALATTFRRGAMPKLEVLKLGRNDIGDQGLVALAPPLRWLRALKEIYLHSNQIGDHGVAVLLANLVHRQLRELNLEHNLAISDAGRATLNAALDVRKSGACAAMCCDSWGKLNIN